MSKFTSFAGHANISAMRIFPITFIFSVLVLVIAACGESAPSRTPTSAPEAAVVPTITPTLTPMATATIAPKATPKAAPMPTQMPTPTVTPAPPTASFSADAESGSAPLMVEFNNTSQGPAISVEWDFGDGLRSTDQSPSHRYTIAGTYTVQLTVLGQGGTGTNVMSDFITVRPGPPVGLEVLPSSAMLAVQEITQFTAIAKDKFGNAVLGDVSWATAGKGGSITDRGLFTADTAAGTFAGIVTAFLEADAKELTATASVTVEPGPVTRVMAEPAEVTLDISDTQPFQVEVFDEFGNKIPDVLVSWKTSTDVGMINPDGLFTAGTNAGVFPASIQVEAVKDLSRASATADVSIRPDPLASMDVLPSFAVVEKGEPYIKSTFIDCFHKLPNQWTSSDLR